MELVIPARDKIYAGEQEKDICLRSLVLSAAHSASRDYRPFMEFCGGPGGALALIKNRLLFIKANNERARRFDLSNNKTEMQTPCLRQTLIYSPSAHQRQRRHRTEKALCG